MRTPLVLIGLLLALALAPAFASATSRAECVAEPLALANNALVETSACTGCGSGWIQIKFRDRYICIQCPPALSPADLLP